MLSRRWGKSSFEKSSGHLLYHSLDIFLMSAGTLQSPLKSCTLKLSSSPQTFSVVTLVCPSCSIINLELEGTLWVFESNPCQGGTLELPNLKLHSPNPNPAVLAKHFGEMRVLRIYMEIPSTSYPNLVSVFPGERE